MKETGAEGQRDKTKVGEMGRGGEKMSSRKRENRSVSCNKPLL